MTTSPAASIATAVSEISGCASAIVTGAENAAPGVPIAARAAPFTVRQTTTVSPLSAVATWTLCNGASVAAAAGEVPAMSAASVTSAKRARPEPVVPAGRQRVVACAHINVPGDRFDASLRDPGQVPQRRGRVPWGA